MVAENDEVWYTGDNLTVVLYKNTDKALDSPPFPPSKHCNLCSEARYEVSIKKERKERKESLSLEENCLGTYCVQRNSITRFVILRILLQRFKNLMPNLKIPLFLIVFSPYKIL